MMEKTRATTTNIGLLDTRYVLKAGDTMGGNLDMNSNCLLGGTAVDSILKLQGTTANGTATSPAIQLLVGNNGVLVGATIINNGSIGFGTASPAAPFHIHRTGSIDELFRFTSYGSSIPSITMGTGEDAPGVGTINLWRAASSVITVRLTGSLTNDTYFNGGNVAIGATSAGGYKLNVTGTLIASDYYSGDGTQGATTTATGLIFKDGLYTSGTVDFTGLVTTDQTVAQTIGSTGARLTKLWATDITVTNAITGSVTGNAGTVTTNANLTGPITSVGNATSIASQTGTGTKFVVDTSPTLITPILGVATGTSLALTGTAAIGTTLSASADLRINSTATHESSLYAGIWQSVSYNPVGTPVAGTSVRGLLFQVSTPAVADDLSNVILYGALGQVTHGGSGALGQAIGMNPGVFLTGSGNVTTSAGITVSATSSGGGAHTSWFGLRAGGITLSGGSTMVNSYAFYADAVTGATNNYAWLSNAGQFVINETGDAASDFRVESDTEANMIFLDANADTDGALYLGGSTNGIKINKGGEMTLLGTATVWDDLRVEAVPRGTGTKAPSFVNWFGGIYLYEFDNALVAAEKEMFFTVQLPHGWKEGSAISPHVHWINKATGTAGHVVRWGIEYTKSKIGGTFSGTPTTVYGTTIAGGGDITVQYEHMLTSFADIVMTGDTISTVLVCRIFRNSSNAADTYTGTAGLLYIDWHFEIDTMGSKTADAK